MGIPPLKTNQRLLDTDAYKANALNDYFSFVLTRENNESLPAGAAIILNLLTGQK